MIFVDPAFLEFNETSTDLLSAFSIDYAVAAEPVTLVWVLAAFSAKGFL